MGPLLRQQGSPDLARNLRRYRADHAERLHRRLGQEGAAFPHDGGQGQKRVTRPTVLGGNYAKGSADIYQAVNSILQGANVQSTVTALKAQLQQLHP